MPQDDVLEYVNDMAAQLAEMCRPDIPELAALLDQVAKEASARSLKGRLAPAQIARRAA